MLHSVLAAWCVCTHVTQQQNFDCGTPGVVRGDVLGWASIVRIVPWTGHTRSMAWYCQVALCVMGVFSSAPQKGEA